MARRTNLIIAVLFGTAVFVLLTAVPSSLLAQSERNAARFVDSEQLFVLGQEESAARRPPSLWDRLKRTMSNLTNDDAASPGGPARDRETSRDASSRPATAVPTTPPRPLTPQDVRTAIDNPDAETEKTPPLAQPAPPAETARNNTVRENAAEAPRLAQNTAASNQRTARDRMAQMRESIFDSVPELDVTPLAPVRPSPRQPVQVAPRQDVAPPPRPPAPVEPRERPTVSMEPQQLPDDLGTRQEFSNRTRIAMGPGIAPETWDDVEPLPPRNRLEPGPAPLSGVNVGPARNVSPWNTNGRTIETADPAAIQRIDIAPQEAPQRAQIVPEREKISGPLIELETVGSPRVIVGQESAYQIRVFNHGGAPAEQVVLTVEIPNWIDVLQPEMSAGTTSITPRPNSEIREFVWKIAKVEAQTKEEIVLNLIPRQRETVDLKIRYDFRKPLVAAKFVVLEPTIAMELQGPSEVMWGQKVGYKLIVRNTGNGDAENIKLELLQTGSDMKSCELPLLRAGEEQVIDVDVWTGKQDHIDINIQATGPYNLSAAVAERITVMRPELDVQVEAPEMLFVGNPAEYTVRIRNIGNATAKDVELVATIPLGARHISSTAGGKLTPQNQVLWSVDAIPSGGEFVASVICEMKREGPCRLEAVANDKSGLVASGTGSVSVESIADLKMQLESPAGPVEVGQEAVFVIHVTNRGTKTAEDVEVIAAFANGLEPFAVEGANGAMNDGQVTFDKIPAISAGQTVTLKVKGRADRPGNLRMRAEVICQAVNAHLVYEQATFFFQKQRNATSFAAESSGGVSSFDQPVPPQNIRKSADSKPLTPLR